MHEIITLQLGQQSNYLATHFWNTQESYFTYAENEESQIDHDIHWRPGLGADGSETFMPRTVIYDLKGGFGSLKKINALYDIADEDPAASSSLWGGQTVVQKAEPITLSAYQQSLDAGLAPPPLTTESVRYWSDFNRVFYHPRSIVQLNDYELNSSLQPFERWDTGEELFANLDKEHDIMDRDLRPFVEEADQMQGIQIFATLDDAWGGFASKYLERLRDEYGKTTVWVWGAQGAAQGVNREKRLLRLVNKAKSLTEMYKQASLLIPISLPSTLSPRLRKKLSFDPASTWHTSALLSAAIESATLPSRLKDAANRDTLGHITDSLNTHGKQTVANLQMSFSDVQDVPHNENAGDEAKDGLKLDMDFRPADEMVDGSRIRNGFHSAPKIFSQVLASRGDRAKDAAAEDEGDEDDRMRRRGQGETISRKYQSTLSYPLLDSFPEIFRDEDGEALQSNIAITTSLSTDAELSSKLRGLRSTVTRFIGLEDRETLGNELAEMADEYHEGWSSGSDFGDDDD
ncbi:mtDNA inheritance, partitioning of the mitochondrial organelle [Gnomoniopsis smithogilvyi]|uniref:MtDNA inheritance, partitioning of the mitochondrial organelle n=1 Tax=Gnomoniopsis smithogilvyi TaxID=1191159 RepID=A0A9W8YWH6_9PEZI|nr:mtDNA inheritance, partitioning of the mitochondrial organelle [Gnomoniopsis smithogilvyi]